MQKRLKSIDFLKVSFRNNRKKKKGGEFTSTIKGVTGETKVISVL